MYLVEYTNSLRLIPSEQKRLVLLYINDRELLNWIISSPAGFNNSHLLYHYKETGFQNLAQKNQQKPESQLR